VLRCESAADEIKQEFWKTIARMNDAYVREDPSLGGESGYAKFAIARKAANHFDSIAQASYESAT
jgi:hypothetical protein